MKWFSLANSFLKPDIWNLIYSKPVLQNILFLTSNPRSNNQWDLQVIPDDIFTDPNASWKLIKTTISFNLHQKNTDRQLTKNIGFQKPIS